MSTGKAAHDPLFEAERKAFMACLTELGLHYDREVKPACLAAGLPKPSSDAGLRQRFWVGLKLGKGLSQLVAEELALRASGLWSFEKVCQDYRLGYLEGF